MHLRRREDRTVEVRFSAVQSRGVSNRNCVVAPANLQRAFEKVWRKGGSAGADEQTVAHFWLNRSRRPSRDQRGRGRGNPPHSFFGREASDHPGVHRTIPESYFALDTTGGISC